jgi:multimeric flavodoxin WrbA
MRFQGCQACGYCKTHYGICRLEDELAPLLKDFNEAGAVVFGTPIYFRQPSGQFRLMQDRLYSFLKPDFSVTLASGKKAVIVTSQGNPDPAMADAVITGLDATLKIYGFKQTVSIKMTSGGSPSAVNARKELLDAAKAAGKAL